MVHQDEPEEASEPLGIIYVATFVERRMLLCEHSAFTLEGSKLLTCPTTESALV